MRNDRARNTSTRLFILFALCAVLGSIPAQADERWIMQGLVDLEWWETDARSGLLKRNGGDPGTWYDLQLWLATEPHPRLQIVAVGQFDGGDAEPHQGGNGSELQQGYVRVHLDSARRISMEAGKLAMPIGNFSSRYLSSVNPLIGDPESYTVSYPHGAQLSATIGRTDLRLALMDRPYVNQHFVPASDRAIRPAVAFGFSPTIGLRLGTYFTRGSYLNEATVDSMAPGEDWRDFDQQVIGLDLRFSRGYLELNADYNRNSYEIPTLSEDADGESYFLETKYTFTPRLFAAVRYGYDRYAKIRPERYASWNPITAEYHSVELGGGFRIRPGLLLKAAYRSTDWESAGYPNGRQVALQLSYGFDVRSWFEPGR